MSKKAVFAKMNQKIKKAWVKALRSGEYKQTDGMLRAELGLGGEGGFGYCCLGVLHHVVTGKQPSMYKTFPSDRLTKKCGIPTVRDEFGRAKQDVCLVLANKNDGGWSFKRIANWIEKNL